MPRKSYKKTYKKSYAKKSYKKKAIVYKNLANRVMEELYTKVKTRTVGNAGAGTSGFYDSGQFIIQITETQHAAQVVFNTKFIADYLKLAGNMFEQMQIAGVRLKMFPNMTEKTDTGALNTRVVPVLYKCQKSNATPGNSINWTVNDVILDADCTSTMFSRPVTMYKKAPTTWTDTDANGVSNIAKRNQWYSLRQITDGNNVVTIPYVVAVDFGPNGIGQNPASFMCVATWYLHFRHPKGTETN